MWLRYIHPLKYESLIRGRPVQSRLGKSRYILNSAYDGTLTGKSMSWQEIADALGLSKGMVYRVAVEGYIPSDERIRKILELDERRKHHNQFRDLFSTPVEMLKNDLENREEV